MKTCENIIASHLGDQEIVIYSGQLQYASTTDQRPSGIRTTAYLKSGKVLLDLLIPNTPVLGTGC
jgi:hypothetical protein